MQVKFLEPMDTEAGRLPAGTIVDHPDCFLLADKGHAVALDAEATETLDRWRQERPQEGQPDRRAQTWQFVGRDVPTIFTLPSGQRITVGVSIEGHTEIVEASDAKRTD